MEGSLMHGIQYALNSCCMVFNMQHEGNYVTLRHDKYYSVGLIFIIKYLENRPSLASCCIDNLDNITR